MPPVFFRGLKVVISSRSLIGFSGKRWVEARSVLRASSGTADLLMIFGQLA